MRILWRCVLVVALLIAGSLLLAGCGGEEEEGAATPAAGTQQAVEEELSLDEYFRQFDRISDDAETRAERLDPEALGQDIEASQDYFDGLVHIFEQTFNDLKNLQPPAEARDAHNEFVAGGEEMQASLEDLSERIAGAESLSELEARLAEPMPALAAAGVRMDDACLQLQGIADENGIEVDLECGEGL
jgi:hypothetical protein